MEYGKTINEVTAETDKKSIVVVTLQELFDHEFPEENTMAKERKQNEKTE